MLDTFVHVGADPEADSLLASPKSEAGKQVTKQIGQMYKKFFGDEGRTQESIALGRKLGSRAELISASKKRAESLDSKVKHVDMRRGRQPSTSMLNKTPFHDDDVMEVRSPRNNNKGFPLQLESAKTRKIVARMDIPIGSRLRNFVAEPEIWNRRRFLMDTLSPTKERQSGVGQGHGRTPSRKIGSAHEQLSEQTKEDMFVEELVDSYGTGGRVAEIVVCLRFPKSKNIPKS